MLLFPTVVDLINSATVKRAAPAKVNLYLHVTGRRPDGYHTLESLVVFASAGDMVGVSLDSKLQCTVSGPFAGALANDSDNLVLRAARALAAEIGRKPLVSIHLTKNLPVAAGLGGGSADAAAILLALCELWDVSLNSSTLKELALGLGADVPVCLAGRPVLVSGIGEAIEPAPELPAAYLVLVNPGVPLSTPRVFAAFAEQGMYCAVPSPLHVGPDNAVSLAEQLRERRNDLEGPAVGLAPEIRDVLQVLRQSPNCLLARMSGSGASCFGLFASAEAAKEIAATLTRERPNWWSVATPMVAVEQERLR